MGAQELVNQPRHAKSTHNLSSIYSLSLHPTNTPSEWTNYSG